jgi:hypothetical protein
MELAKSKFSIVVIALLLNLLALLLVQQPEPGLAAPTQPLPLPGLTPFYLAYIYDYVKFQQIKSDIFKHY